MYFIYALCVIDALFLVALFFEKLFSGSTDKTYIFVEKCLSFSDTLSERVFTSLRKIFRIKLSKEMPPVASVSTSTEKTEQIGTHDEQL